MKRRLVALAKMILWYEANLAPTRVSFAGGVMAGSFITLVLGFFFGFTYDTALGSAIFAIVMFIVMAFAGSILFSLGKRYGDRKPVCDILKEVEKRKNMKLKGKWKYQ